MCVHGRRRYLPDLPILSIFEALPLYKLLKTGRVCPRFAQLQAEALANRKMLTIFIGENVDRKKYLYESKLFFEPHLDSHTTREAEEAMADYSALELKTLSQEMVNWLKSTFPRVTKLRVILGHGIKLSDVKVNVIQLLEHWAGKLESFGLFALYSFDIVLYPNLLQSLFALISEKLHSLQFLTIAILAYRNASPLNLDLSFLGRLKFFCTNVICLDNPQQMLDSLNHNGALLENLPEIRLFGYSDPAKVQVLPPRLASKITALFSADIVYPAENGPQQDLSVQFPALKWYKQIGFEDDIGSFFISLSKLSHLAYLELVHVPFRSPERFQFQQELPPLSGVKTLSISGYVPDHHFLSLLGPLDRLFPSLKTIKLKVRMYYDSTESAPIRKCFPSGESRKSVYRSASKARIEETFGGLMRQFAQLALKGSLAVELMFQEDAGDVKFKYFCSYAEEFNFTDGGSMEDWQIMEANILD